MKLDILNVSVGIAAKDHNPAILHPAFLKAQAIVTNTEPAEPPICTPAFATVKYANGLVFTVESRKFLVTDNNLPEDFSDSLVPQLATKYIEALPHVRYIAVGINMMAFIEYDNPESFIIKRFLMPGKWNEETLKLKSTELRFIYDAEGAILRLSCQSGGIQKPQEDKKRGILLDANYNTDLPDADALEEANKVIGSYRNRCQHFLEVTKRIFDLD